MKPDPEPPYVAKTLAWCNDIARKRGLPTHTKLPKGYKGDYESCPCGQVTGFHVGYHRCERYEKDCEKPIETIDTPPFVVLFAKDFDGGKLPQYDASLDLTM